MPPFLPRFGLDESWRSSCHEGIFFFLFKIWRVLAGNSTKVSAAHRGSEPGVAVFVERMCFWVSFRKRCRRKRTGRRRELLCWCSGRFSRKSVCRPGAPGSLGVRPAPSTPLPRLITWRAKQPAGGCVNARYLRGRLALRHPERPALSVRQRQAGSRPGSFAFWRRCVEEGLVRNWRFLPVLCPSSLSLFLDQADRRADFVVVVVVFNEFQDLSFSFYTLASPWNTYLCQQPQTLTSAGLVSVNGFLFSQFLFFTVLPMLPFWVRFTGSLVWN